MHVRSNSFMFCDYMRQQVHALKMCRKVLVLCNAAQAAQYRNKQLGLHGTQQETFTVCCVFVREHGT